MDSRHGEKNKMAITKTIEEDKIEIVGVHRAIQIREATVIKEDGKELTRSFNRRVLHCIQSSHDGSSWKHTDTDVSSESDEVKGIAGVVWTDSVKASKKTANEASL